MSCSCWEMAAIVDVTGWLSGVVECRCHTGNSGIDHRQSGTGNAAFRTAVEKYFESFWSRQQCGLDTRSLALAARPPERPTTALRHPGADRHPAPYPSPSLRISTTPHPQPRGVVSTPARWRSLLDHRRAPRRSLLDHRRALRRSPLDHRRAPRRSLPDHQRPPRRVTRGACEVFPYIRHHGDPYVFPDGVAQQEHPCEGGLDLAIPFDGQEDQQQAQACAQEASGAAGGAERAVAGLPAVRHPGRGGRPRLAGRGARRRGWCTTRWPLGR